MPSSSIRGRINRNIDMSKLQQQHARRQDSVMGSVSTYTNSRRSSGLSSNVEAPPSPASDSSMDSPLGFLPIQQPTEADYRDWARKHYEPTYISAMKFMWVEDASSRGKEERGVESKPTKPVKHISQAMRKAPQASASKQPSSKSTSQPTSKHTSRSTSKATSKSTTKATSSPKSRSNPTCPTHIPSAYYQPSIDKGPGSRLGDRQPFSRSKRPSALHLQHSNGSTVASVVKTAPPPSRGQVTSPSLSLTATKAFAKYKRSIFGNGSQTTAYGDRR